MIEKSAQTGRYSKHGRDARKRTGRKVRAKAPKGQEPPQTATEATEAQLQAAAEEYLDACGLRYIHVPAIIGRLCNFADRRLRIHEKAMLSAAFKGVPDLLIFGQGKPYARCLVMELKVGKNSVTTDQREFLNDCYGDEWPGHAVCYTIDAVIDAVNDFMVFKETGKRIAHNRQNGQI